MLYFSYSLFSSFLHSPPPSHQNNHYFTAGLPPSTKSFTTIFTVRPPSSTPLSVSLPKKSLFITVTNFHRNKGTEYSAKSVGMNAQMNSNNNGAQGAMSNQCENAKPSWISCEIDAVALVILLSSSFRHGYIILHCLKLPVVIYSKCLNHKAGSLSLSLCSYMLTF